MHTRAAFAGVCGFCSGESARLPRASCSLSATPDDSSMQFSGRKRRFAITAEPAISFVLFIIAREDVSRFVM